MLSKFLLLLLCLPAVGFCQNGWQRQIETLEQQRFEAMVKKDLAFLEKVLADDLTYTHSNGFFETKSDHLANIREGTLVYNSMQPEQSQARRYGKTIINNGFINVEGVLRGKDFKVRLRYTDVYVKRKGRWQLAAWHSVRAE